MRVWITMKFQTIPIKDRIKMRNKKIKAFQKLGFSMNEICGEMQKIGYNVSKTTVFFALNGRSKKANERNSRRRKINRLINKK